jgi:RNA polymerase sigma factor (sigma-70 family)
VDRNPVNLEVAPLLTPRQEVQIAERLRFLRRRLLRAMLANDFVLHEISVILRACAQGKRRIEFTFDVTLCESVEKQRIRRGVSVLIPRLEDCLDGNRQLVDHLARTEPARRPVIWRQVAKRRRDIARELMELGLRIEIVGALFKQLASPHAVLAATADARSQPFLVLPCGETPGTWTRRSLRVERLQGEYQAAKELLILSHLRLVRSFAKQYRNRGVGYYDLIQEGSLGLMRAAEKFDAGHGTRFSTYATWWIRQAVIRAVTRQSSLMNLPKSARDRVRSLDKLKGDSSQVLGRRPNLDELAELAGLSPRDTFRTATWMTRPASFDRLALASENDTASPHSHDPASIVQRRMLRQQVAEAVGELSRREREIIQLRYGLLDGITRSLAEVGVYFSLTRERIRQIERIALGKLQTSRLQSLIAG